MSQQQINEVRNYLTRDTMPVSDDDPLSRLPVTARIALAFTRTRNAKKQKRPVTTSQALSQYRRLAKALRNVETIGKEDLREDFYNDLVQKREYYEGLIDMLDAGRRRDKSGGARNVGRETAVREAFLLLAHFGDRPQKTRGGAWHMIANTLYGSDLWSTLEHFERSNIVDEIELLPDGTHRPYRGLV